ncbi:MAG: methylphosphotriester-DNA--protein-cysteine methyltransferase family protein [Parasporobacterium sp.]|nr:methylphosphotriester-DNA--protein-cysteine methyltransferase family protein [Parasporobacterium sp.]
MAIRNKDASYDGKFVYVLKTTGTICRPSCEKKVAAPNNIIVFDSTEEALAAGYHLCKRCRPDQVGWKGARQELTDDVLKLIHENYARDFSLEVLAEELHINKFHLLRTFKLVTGQTPLQYHNWYRCEKAKELLRQPELSISYIAYETGFNSASHFSRVFNRVTSMTPSEYRKEDLKNQKEKG